MLVRLQHFWQNLRGTHRDWGLEMWKTLSSILIALVLGWSGAVHAGDFQTGDDAYEVGD